MPEFQFDSIADFFRMGGYAFFVWSAYLFFAVVMLWNLWLPVRERRAILKLLAARAQREAVHHEGSQ